MAAGLRKRLRRLALSERGMALPTALFATIASVGLAGAAVMSSVDVQRGSKRDSGSKSAIAAADAGANVAMLRLNREREDLVEDPCLDGAEPADGWCPPVSGSVGTATYAYRVSSTEAEGVCEEFDLCVSVTGTAGEVSRRILVSFNQGAPGSGGGGSEEEEKEGESGEEGGGGGPEGLIGKDKISLSGSADIRVNIGTNGSIEGSGSSHSVCGNIRHGVGKEVDPEVNQCDGFGVSEENVDLPPVSSFMPADIATNNANARVTTCSAGLPVECQTAGYSGNWNSQPPFDTGNRRISLSGSKTLTLPEGDYWICSLELSGSSELIMQAGAQVRLFFDTPENCGTTTPLSLSGNVKIKATGYNASTASFEMPGFFFLGSPTTPTTINLSGNFGTINELVIYAPETDVNISGNATFKGLFVGETINVGGSGTLENDDGFVLPPWLNPWPEEEEEPGEEEEEEETTPGFFTPQFYVECTGATATEPDANC